MSDQAINKDSISIALVGKGGAGVLTAGAILLTAAARCGRYGLLIPAVGPQIRGGESAALLRLGETPINCLDDHFDVLLGINWQHAERFRTDIPLTADSLVVTDPSAGDVPEFITAAGVRIHELEMQALSATVTGGRPNMVALLITNSFISVGLTSYFPPRANPKSCLVKSVALRIYSSMALTCSECGWEGSRSTDINEARPWMPINRLLKS